VLELVGAFVVDVYGVAAAHPVHEGAPKENICSLLFYPRISARQGSIIRFNLLI
jgi:hypothetical protein